MHRIIMNCPEDRQVDHINGDGLDNRKSNLRVCTQRQNSCNTLKYSTNKSGYKGVSFSKDTNKWRATIVVNYKQIHLGLFNTPEEAAEAYINKAREIQGEFFPKNRVA